MAGADVANVQSWIEQTLIIASIGAVLPKLFRLQHPRTQVVYGHVLLALCLLLPLLQPWRHRLVPDAESKFRLVEFPRVTPRRDASRLAGGASASSETQPASTSQPLFAQASHRVRALFSQQDFRDRLLLWTIGIGVIGRLGWLLIGLWQIRSYRIGATPLYPIPDSMKAASAITHADALICVSPHAPGPVTLGWLAPFVLLPESVHALGEEALCGIVCHELLHVKRHDWLITLFEELVGTLLCFNPAVWWLLAQTRLAREQLVDAEVVRLTGTREPYIEALLCMARAGLVSDLAPAPLFLRKHQLAQRMRVLLKETSMSTSRVFSSYVSMVAIIVVAGWWSCVSFPLTRRPRTARPDMALVSTNRPESDVKTLALQAPQNHVSQRPSAERANPAPRLTPVPRDPLELVTSLPETINTPEARARLFALLIRGINNQAFPVPSPMDQADFRSLLPYTLKISFTASGQGVQGGIGDMEETRNSSGARRWTGQLGDYSLTRVIPDRWYDMGSPGPIPLRLAMARRYAFGFPVGPIIKSPAAFASRSVRTANVTLHGVPVTCILIAAEATTAPGRDWSESETCVDPELGVFRLFSQAPGMYAVYDYDKTSTFHGHTTPARVTVTIAGSEALQGSIAVLDPDSSLDPTLFKPTSQMTTGGAGLVETRQLVQLRNATLSSGEVQPVVVHATIAPEGSVIEAEALQAPDSTLSRSAVDLVKNTKYPSTVDYGYPIQQEVFVTVQ